jgi:hypothetical protein
MSKRGLFTGALVCFVFLAFLSPARGDISTIYPTEGTVGTIFTLYGSGFGEKRGKVLLGTEKCKVLDWSDSEIECLITKAQPPGDYPVTVSLQGNKKRFELMMYSFFAMRAPRITPPGSLPLLPNGNIFTINGAFFGVKKGDITLVDRRGETGKARVVDWSMGSIRFELPDSATGACILRVSNVVGEDELTHPSCNPPAPGGDLCYDRGNDPPPSKYYDAKYFHDANSSAAYYDGHLFFFSVGSGNLFHDPPIQVQRFENGKFVADNSEPSMPSGTTYTTVVPLVIENKLWVFVTGCNGGLYYTRYSMTGGWEDQDWLRIPDVSTNHKWEIAPVYNPDTGGIEVYYENNGTLMCVVSEDFGSTWSESEKPWLEQIPQISSAPSAVFYQEASATILALAVGIEGEGNVFLIDDKLEIFDHHVVGSVIGRPFLVDLDADEIALIWRHSPGDSYDTSYISKMDKVTRVWGSPYEPIGDWTTNWSPNGFINYESNSTGGLDGIFYLLWGYPDCTAGQSIAVTWVMNRLENLGPVIEMLDQSQPVSESPQTVSYDVQRAQIFTAGVSGDLNRVSLRLENYWSSLPTGAVLNISVQAVIGGLPSGEQIGTGTIPLSAIPAFGSGGDWVDVDISGASVRAGIQYALVLRTSVWNANVTWWLAYQNAYGSSYTRGESAFNYGSGWSTDESYDFTFKTYVMTL